VLGIFFGLLGSERQVMLYGGKPGLQGTNCDIAGAVVVGDIENPFIYWSCRHFLAVTLFGAVAVAMARR